MEALLFQAAGNGGLVKIAESRALDETSGNSDPITRPKASQEACIRGRSMEDRNPDPALKPEPLFPVSDALETESQPALPASPGRGPIKTAFEIRVSLQSKREERMTVIGGLDAMRAQSAQGENGQEQATENKNLALQAETQPSACQGRGQEAGPKQRARSRSAADQKTRRHA